MLRISTVALWCAAAAAFSAPARGARAGPAPPRMSLFTSVESLVTRPYYALEKSVASKQIPSIATAPAPRLKLADVASDEGGASFDHALWDGVLQAHVSDGLVDYVSLAADARFAAYLEQLAAADVAALSKPEQLALWCNAYNALCVNHVVSRRSEIEASAMCCFYMPLPSGVWRGGVGHISTCRGGAATCADVTDPPGMFARQPVKKMLATSSLQAGILDLSSKERAIWDAPAGVVGGEPVSLNDVEHGKLRLVWDEPGVHACIVCASTSCPDLSSRAFVADGLAVQMEARVRAWLASPTKGCAVERDGAVARLSRIMLWFADDFAAAGGAAAFAARYVDGASNQAALRSKGVALRFFPYDWSLNSKG